MKILTKTFKSRPPRSALNMTMAILLEGLFVLFPMIGISVILYDITMKGWDSAFSIVLVSAVGTYALFRAVTFVMGFVDEWPGFARQTDGVGKL